MLMLWIIFALMVLLALWFVLPALLQKAVPARSDELRAANLSIYQDQLRELAADLENGLIGAEQYRQDKDDLERRLLEDVAAEKTVKSPSPPPGNPKVAYAVGVIIPVAALTLYLVLGSPKAVTGQMPATAGTVTPPFANQEGPMTQQQIAANVAKLANRLQQNPDDLNGWLMLARSYTMMERYADAAAAYEQATRLDKNNADLWADYAGAVAGANNRQVDAKLMAAINRALEIDPNNGKALAIAGSAAFASKDYAKAAAYWQKLLPRLEPGSEEARMVADQVARAKDLAAGKTER